jgi:hypothetical protein
MIAREHISSFQSKFRYPFNACELLANDNTTTVEAFFPDEPQTVDEKVMEDVEVEVEEEV